MAMRAVISTIVGILAIGWILASVAPPHWQSCEMVLLVACIALIWECFRSEDQMKGRAAAWLDAGTGDPQSGGFRPWDVERAVARFRPAAVRATSDLHFAASRQPMEQITHEMLTQAFRQASLKHHPADISDAENTRRVYLAREMILRAVHKN